jgi:hypothetical protein
MDRSRFIAALLGPTMALIAVSIVINGGMVAEMVEQISANYAMIFISGIITLPVGLAIVIGHNIWKGWPVIITVFGWIAVAAGVARIVFAPHLAGLATGMATGTVMMVTAAVYFVLGLFLSWKAFRA